MWSGLFDKHEPLDVPAMMRAHVDILFAGRGMNALRILAVAAALALGACREESGRLQGWVEADLVFVGPDEAGRIETLHVREGDTVAAGVPLFAIDSELQSADVHTASAQVAEARARLARLETAQQRKEEIAVLEAQEKPRAGDARRSPPSSSSASRRCARGAFRRRRSSTSRRPIPTATRPRSKKSAARSRSRAWPHTRRTSRRHASRSRPRSRGATRRETKLARRKLAAPVDGAVQQVYYRPGEMVPAARPVLSILPPGNIKLRFFVAQALLPKIALGDAVAVRATAATRGSTAKVSFIARTAEYTPPVIYSLEERNKLVFMVEARPDAPDGCASASRCRSPWAKVAEARK